MEYVNRYKCEALNTYIQKNIPEVKITTLAEKIEDAITEEDINYLLEHINTDAPFTLDRSQILVGTHGQYTPAIGAALYYVEKFTQSV